MISDWTGRVFTAKDQCEISTLTALFRISTRQRKTLEKALPFVKFIATTDLSQVDLQSLQATAKAILKEI